jgi:hypothetical protein
MHCSDLQAKRVAVFDDMTRSSACEMGADNQGRCTGQPAEDFAAGPGRLLSIVISTRRPGRPGKLAGVMNEAFSPCEEIATLTCPGVCPTVGTKPTSSQIWNEVSTRSTSPASNTGLTESSKIAT